MRPVRAMRIDPCLRRSEQVRRLQHGPAGPPPARGPATTTCADISAPRLQTPPLNPRAPTHSLDRAEAARRVRAGIRVLQQARAAQRGGARSIEDDYTMAGTP